MATIIIQLDPSQLANTDTDIRYVLPDLLAAKFPHLVSDDGYDYAGSSQNPCLLVFLATESLEQASAAVIGFLQHERVLENDLASVPVAIEDEDAFKVIHPPDFSGSFFYPSPEAPDL